MRGADIPLETVYTIGRNGTTTHKEPLYELKSTKEIKAIQDKLGGMLSFYYGTWCNKCCGVYPAFYTEMGFKDDGYYVCLVCGKESKHEPMGWMARDDWNNGIFKWEPDKEEFRQMTINDFLGGAT